MKAGGALVLALICAFTADKAQGDFGSAISNAINSATSTVTDTANTVANSVSDATNTAVTSVSGAVTTGTNAVQGAVQTVGDTTQRTVDVSEHWIGNTANTVSSAVVNFTQDQWTAANGVAGDVGTAISGITGSAVNLGQEAGGQINKAATIIPGTGTPAGPAGIDAADPAAIEASLGGAGGYAPYAVGILSALAAGQDDNVAAAAAKVIVDGTGNDTRQVQVAQAWATAMGIAQNDTSKGVNSTQVADVFMASLQDAIIPCEGTLNPQAQPGTPEFSQAVANGCCSVINKVITTEAMVSDLIGTDAAFYAALQNSDAFGTQPKLNLGKCLTDQTEVS